MRQPSQLKEFFQKEKVCIIIPTYNNQQTILQVIEDIKAYCADVLVVNDGSTDDTFNMLSSVGGIDLISYQNNKGKGFAIRQGFKRALESGFDYAITFDADGQHFAEDLTVFAKKLKDEPDAIIIGSRNIEIDGMPSKNTFANKFSNFWFWVETGDKLPDTQSGFRLYPVKLYKNSKFFTNKYEFEIEVLVRSAWRGIKILPVPIHVAYPDDRVSHFQPLPDFTRISLLNTVLVFITFLYIVPRNVLLYFRQNKVTTIIKEQFSAHNESPMKIAAALGFGVFMGIIPIWGFQMLTAAFLAHFLRLNKILVLAASNISLPPLIPFIVYFSYEIGGFVLGRNDGLTKENLLQLKEQIMDGQFYVTFQELGYSLFQYIVGGFVLGTLLGVMVGLITYIVLKISSAIKDR